MTLESNRMLGGIGALLIVISSITSFLSLAQFFFPSSVIGVLGAPFGLLGLAGLILFMIAMKGFATHYKDLGIFNNALYWVLTNIIAGVVAVALSFAVLFSVLSSIIRTMAPFTTANPPTLSAVLDALRPFIVYFIPVGVVVFAMMVLSVVFMMRAFNRLAAASGIPLFRTVGLMFLVGIALTGALGLLTALLVFSGSIAISAVLPLTVVSGLVSFVTWILATIGFFRIRAQTSETFPQPTSQAVASGAQVKYCPRCGAENVADATYCTHCGQKL
jgi:uncharacterized membrane protein/ribosomal protein L40E